MNLNLNRPIIFFDLETTGTNIVTDRIVEISYLKIDPQGNETTKTYMVNPGMPIPPSSTAVHGITDADVADKPLFKEIAQNIADDFRDADVGGYNSNRFDVPLLVEEFLRNGIDVDFSTKKMLDVQAIFHKMEQRTLSAAYKFYCDKDLADAHSAEADTRATYEVLKAQLDRYPALTNDVKSLADISAYSRVVDFAGRIILNDKDIEVFNFGKYKGQPVVEVLMKDPGYFSWIMNSDFTLNTKNELSKIKHRQVEQL